MPPAWSRDESDPRRWKFSQGVQSAKTSSLQCAESVFSPGGGWAHQKAHCVPSMGGSVALRLRAEQVVSKAGLTGAWGLPPMKGGVTRRSPGSPAGQVHKDCPSLHSPSSLDWPGHPRPLPSPPLSPRAGPPGCPSALLQAPTAPSVMPLVTPDPGGLPRLATHPRPRPSPWAKVRNQDSSSSEVPGPGLRLGAIVIIRVCLLNE